MFPRKSNIKNHSVKISVNGTRGKCYFPKIEEDYKLTTEN